MDSASVVIQGIGQVLNRDRHQCQEGGKPDGDYDFNDLHASHRFVFTTTSRPCSAKLRIRLVISSFLAWPSLRDFTSLSRGVVGWLAGSSLSIPSATKRSIQDSAEAEWAFSMPLNAAMA